jgi:hypothetical protein
MELVNVTENKIPKLFCILGYCQRVLDHNVANNGIDFLAARRKFPQF